MKTSPMMLDNNTLKRAIPVMLLLAALVLLGVSIRVQFLASFYGDKQWEMLYAQMLVGGKRLYIDIFPVSPPLIFWIYALPASLTLHQGFPAEFNALITMGLCAIAVSVYVSTRLIALHPGFAGMTKMRVEFILLLCFVLIFRTSPIYFLDREHLFFVLTLPYLIRFMPSLARAPVSPALRVITGVMAGIGFSIKPYCLAVWAGIQLLACLKEKSLRALIAAENLIIYAASLIYVFFIWRLTPDYFTTVLPMALATYSATRDSHSTLDYLTNAVAVLFLTFLMFRPRHTSPYRADIYYLCGLCPFFLLYALLNNNWAYTYYPLGSIALLLTGFVLWEFLYLRRAHASQHLPTRILTLGICACLLTFAIKSAISLTYFNNVFHNTCHDDPACKGDDPFIEEVREGGGLRSFGAISIDFARWTRLSHFTGAEWRTRFSQLWMLPKFLVSDDNFLRRHEWILAYVAEAFAEDMDKRKPDIMFVDDSDVFYTARGNLDLVSFFSVNPHFQNAFGHYRFAHRIYVCGVPGLKYSGIKDRCSYFVYRRVP